MDCVSRACYRAWDTVCLPFVLNVEKWMKLVTSLTTELPSVLLEGFIAPQSIVDPHLAFQSTADLGHPFFNPLNNTLPPRLRGPGMRVRREEQSQRLVRCAVAIWVYNFFK